MKNTSEIPNVYSVNSYSIELNENSKLDAELAKQIVTEWYKTGEGYKYDEEPSSDTAGKFILLHMIFIITFLELIGNCYTKCRNKFTIHSI